MQRLKAALVVSALVTSSAACGDVATNGRSPMYLVIDRLEGARGGSTSPSFGTPVLSDVITNVTSPAPCSSASPCPTVFNDLGQVALRAASKDMTVAPSTYSDVTITRYHVIYRRADGRNTQGSDVPWAFDGAATGTVPAGGTLTLNFELVRHAAKTESPLAQLVSNPIFMTTLAEVTFYGWDQAGNKVSVTGLIQVDFGNFGDL